MMSIKTSLNSKPSHTSNLVSVIMPCFNSEDTVAEAIESVLSQDYRWIELLIIDDGSSDRSVDIIKHYQSLDHRVKFFNNFGFHGVANARNIGIENSVGRYICFLDSDDYLLPGSILARVNKMTNDIKIVYGPYLRLTTDGIFSQKMVPSFVSMSKMLKKNYIGNLTGMYDSEALGKYFQKSMKHEDYLMWCQLLSAGVVAVSVGSEPIAVYRVSSNSLSGNKFKAFIWHWVVLRRGLGINFFLSFYYQLFYLLSSFFERIVNFFVRKFK